MPMTSTLSSYTRTRKRRNNLPEVVRNNPSIEKEEEEMVSPILDDSLPEESKEIEFSPIEDLFKDKSSSTETDKIRKELASLKNQLKTSKSPTGGSLDYSGQPTLEIAQDTKDLLAEQASDDLDFGPRTKDQEFVDGVNVFDGSSQEDEDEDQGIIKFLSNLVNSSKGASKGMLSK